MSSPGYSGTPLSKKLGVKPGSSLCILSDPIPGTADVEATIREQEPAVVLHEPPFDVSLLFATTQAQLIASLDSAIQALKKDGGLWICWPKKSSGVATDLTENLLRDLILPLGLVDNKVCAVTDVWSGLRFVWRKELR